LRRLIHAVVVMAMLAVGCNTAATDSDIIADAADTAAGTDLEAPDLAADDGSTPDLPDSGWLSDAADAGEIDANDDGTPDATADAPDNLSKDDTTATDESGDSPGDAGDTTDAPDEGPSDTYVTPDIPEHGELQGKGFFTVQAHEGRWWFVTPDGLPFYSIGINACNPNGSVDASTGENRYKAAVENNYPGETWAQKADSWAAATADRLKSWGFNTVGAWSDWNRLGKTMPYTVILNISGVDWQVGDIPDYFSQEFADRCAQVARDTVAPRRDDPNLIGWFLDNELRWGWDWRSPKTLLQDYLAMPESTPGHAVALEYQGRPYEFLAVVAAKYFQVTTEAVRSADPNHLILGIRSISVMTHPQVPQAAGPWVDVYSVNNYEFLPELYDAIDAAEQDFLDEGNWLLNYYGVTGRPIMITEFSMRSSEADVPSTWPVFYPTYPTQAERAAAYQAYTENCFAKPYIIGQHWFQWADEPAGGRFDGENSNFGLVDGDDKPYTKLVETMTLIHAQAPDRALE